MQLSDHSDRWWVIFPTSTEFWVGDCFGDGFGCLVLFPLAFVLSAVVLICAFWGVAFTFAFPAAALVTPSRALVVGVGTAGVEGLSAAAGRIRG